MGCAETGAKPERYFTRAILIKEPSMSYRTLCWGAGALLLVAPGLTSAASPNDKHPAAVMLSSTRGSAAPVPQKVRPPTLNLTDQDRQKIRDALAQQNDQTVLTKKSSQAERDFKPTIGAKVPAGFAKGSDALPQDLVRQMPVLKEYSYLVYNNEILIVDPMSKKVVDRFPAS
jgi:hypothetical protein